MSNLTLSNCERREIAGSGHDISQYFDVEWRVHAFLGCLIVFCHWLVFTRWAYLGGDRIRRICSLLAGFANPEKSIDGPLAAVVSEEILKDRLSYAENIGCFASFCYVLSNVKIAIVDWWLGFGQQGGTVYHSWMWMLGGLMLLLRHAFPRAASWHLRGTPLVYMLYALWCMLMLMPFDAISRGNILLHNTAGAVIIVALAPASPIVAQRIVAILYSVVVTVSYGRVYHYKHPDDLQLDTPQLEQMQAWQLGILLPLMLSVGQHVSGTLASLSRARVLTKAADSERQAVSSLLDISCDAVIELDSCRMIAKHSHKFGGLLMDVTRSLEGISLASLLYSSEDEQTLERLLGSLVVVDPSVSYHSSLSLSTEGKDSKKAAAAVGSLNLRDCMGGRVPVELSLVPQRKLVDSAPCFILGIREMQSQQDTVSPCVTPKVHVMPLRPLSAAELDRERANNQVSMDIGDDTSTSSILDEMSDQLTGDQERAPQQQVPEVEGVKLHPSINILHDADRHRSMLADMGLLSTSGRAMDMSLVSLFHHWHTRRHHPECCHMHRCLKDLNKVARRLRAHRCFDDPGLGVNPLLQCRRCGYMAYVQGEILDAEGNCLMCAAVGTLSPPLKEERTTRAAALDEGQDAAGFTFESL